jgi:methionyl aminopeptidase
MVTLKTKEDIAILREGGKRHAQIMKELVAMVAPGVKAADIDARAQELIKAGGDTAAFLNYQPEGASRPYPASVCISVNDEIVHGIPNEAEKILKEGDVVSIDLGLIHKKLITDMAVTVPVGKVSPELETLLKVTKEALMAGIKAAKGGRRIGDIGSAISLIAQAHGYGVVEELSGHGVGYHVHEDPFVPNYGTPGKGSILKPGMVIAIEPMFNLGTKKVTLDADDYTYRTADGKPSAHFEHTIVITKGDAEILTQG